MSNLTRYDLRITGNIVGPPSVGMVENRSGEYVKFDDAIDLSKTVTQQLKAEISALLLMAQYYVTPDGMSPEGSIKLIDKLRKLSAV